MVVRSKDFYAVLALLIASFGLFGLFIFYYFNFNDLVNSIGLVISGAFVGTGISTGFALSASSNSDQAILRKIDTAFEIVDNRYNSHSTVSEFFKTDFYLYYTSANDKDIFWKIAYVHINENISNRILRGSYSISTLQGQEIKYVLELISVKNKVVLLTNNPGTSEATVVGVLIDPIDQFQAFGVEQSETWVNAQKVGPLIATKKLLFSTHFPSEKLDNKVGKKLYDAWSVGRIQNHFQINKEVGNED